MDQSDFSLQLRYVYQVLDCLSFEFSMLDVSKNGILNKYTLYQNYTCWEIVLILVNGVDQIRVIASRYSLIFLVG